MSGAAGALQRAVFAALGADAGLVALLGGANIFDGAPRNAAAPYVHLGEVEARDWSTATDAGVEIVFTVVAWSRQAGRAEALAIAERVRAVLHDAELVVDGWRLVNLRHLATATERLEKPEGRRAVVRFRAVMEEA
jgi:hypothetical protein